MHFLKPEQRHVAVEVLDSPIATNTKNYSVTVYAVGHPVNSETKDLEIGAARPHAVVSEHRFSVGDGAKTQHYSLLVSRAGNTVMNSSETCAGVKPLLCLQMAIKRRRMARNLVKEVSDANQSFVPVTPATVY